MVLDIEASPKLANKSNIDSLERESRRLEDYVKKSLDVKNRVKSPKDLNEYRKEIITVSLVSIVNFTCCFIFVIYSLLRLDEIRPGMRNVTIVVLILVTIFSTLLPYLYIAFKQLFGTALADIFFAKSRISKTIHEVERVNGLTKYYCDLFIELGDDFEKAKYEYIIKKAQISARKNLALILNATNYFISHRTFSCVRHKYKEKYIKRLEACLKDLHGSLIISFKGKLNKDITDGLERVGKNLIIIKGRM